MGLFSVKAESPEQLEKYISVKSQSGDRGVQYGDTIYLTSAESSGLYAYDQEITENNLFLLEKKIKGESETVLVGKLGFIALGRKFGKARQFIDIRVPIKTESSNGYNKVDYRRRYYPTDEYTHEEGLYSVPDDIALQIAARAVYDVATGQADAYKDDYAETTHAYDAYQKELRNLLEDLISEFRKGR